MSTAAATVTRTPREIALRSNADVASSTRVPNASTETVADKRARFRLPAARRKSCGESASAAPARSWYARVSVP